MAIFQYNKENKGEKVYDFISSLLLASKSVPVWDTLKWILNPMRTRRRNTARTRHQAGWACEIRHLEGTEPACAGVCYSGSKAKTLIHFFGFLQNKKYFWWHFSDYLLISANSIDFVPKWTMSNFRLTLIRPNGFFLGKTSNNSGFF